MCIFALEGDNVHSRSRKGHYVINDDNCQNTGVAFYNTEIVRIRHLLRPFYESYGGPVW